MSNVPVIGINGVGNFRIESLFTTKNADVLNLFLTQNLKHFRAVFLTQVILCLFLIYFEFVVIRLFLQFHMKSWTQTTRLCGIALLPNLLRTGCLIFFILFWNFLHSKPYKDGLIGYDRAYSHALDIDRLMELEECVIS